MLISQPDRQLLASRVHFVPILNHSNFACLSNYLGTAGHMQYLRQLAFCYWCSANACGYLFAKGDHLGPPPPIRRVSSSRRYNSALTEILFVSIQLQPDMHKYYFLVWKAKVAKFGQQNTAYVFCISMDERA